MKLSKLFAATLLTLGASLAHAGVVNPDCDASKVATNAAVKATTGVSGRCTPAKTADRAVDDATKDAKKAVKKTTKKVDKATDNLGDSVSNAKDNVNDLKEAPVKSLVN